MTSECRVVAIGLGDLDTTIQWCLIHRQAETLCCNGRTMSEPMTEAGRRLLGFIDAAIENTTNGESWRNGAGYARVCAENSIPVIENEMRAEARAATLADVRREVEAEGPTFAEEVCCWSCSPERWRVLAILDRLERG